MAEERFDEQIQVTPNLSPNTDINPNFNPPLTSSGDINSSSVQSTIEGESAASKAKSRLFSFGRDVYSRMGQIPSLSKNAVSQVDSQARLRPWAFISGIGIGSLILGYVLGRGLSFSSSPVISGISPDDIEDYT